MQPKEEWSDELKEALKTAHHVEFDIEAARDEAIRRLPKNHAWKQFGPHVICQSCHAQHSQYVGITKSLTTNEEGEYVLIDRF